MEIIKISCPKCKSQEIKERFCYETKNNGTRSYSGESQENFWAMLCQKVFSWFLFQLFFTKSQWDVCSLTIQYYSHLQIPLFLLWCYGNGVDDPVFSGVITLGLAPFLSLLIFPSWYRSFPIIFLIPAIFIFRGLFSCLRLFLSVFLIHFWIKRSVVF